MARDESGPFSRGETYYNGGFIDSTNLGGVNLEGKEYVFEVNAPDAVGVYQGDTSGRSVRVRVVRNVSGVNLLPARVAHYAAAYPFACHVDGYTYAVGDQPAGIIDEILPPAGVPNNDLFYLVVGGPSRVTQNATSPATLAVGSVLVPDVDGAASRTDVLGGRVALQDLTGATATLGNNIQNVVGYSDGVDTGTANLIVPIVVKRSDFSF